MEARKSHFSFYGSPNANQGGSDLLSSPPLHYDGGGRLAVRNLSAWRKRGRRGEGMMERSALPPITRREKVRPSRWSEQVEGNLKRGRFLRESSSLAASLSGGPFAVCTRRPCLASLPPTHTSPESPDTPDQEAVQSQKPEFSTPSLLLPELSDGMFFPLGY